MGKCALLWCIGKLVAREDEVGRTGLRGLEHEVCGVEVGFRGCLDGKVVGWRRGGVLSHKSEAARLRDARNELGIERQRDQARSEFLHSIS